MSGILVAPTFVSMTNLRDVNDAAKADQYAIVWDSGTAKHVYVANVAAAATDASSYGFVIDEDNMASDLATKVPTQQSVKAYVDSVVAGLTYLASEDIDTLAEINAIIGDATLVTVEATDASGYGWVVDEDNLASDLDTKVPTQQSVKAYVDALTLGDSLPVTDTTAIAKGSADATKLVRLEVDGLTTGTTRVLTVQDADGTIAYTGHAHATSDITSGTLTHERGGLEADISAIAIGDVIAGTGSGTLGLVTATGHSDGDVLTIQADGSVDFETPSGGGSSSVAHNMLSNSNFRNPYGALDTYYSVDNGAYAFDRWMLLHDGASSDIEARTLKNSGFVQGDVRNVFTEPDAAIMLVQFVPSEHLRKFDSTNLTAQATFVSGNSTNDVKMQLFEYRGSSRSPDVEDIVDSWSAGVPTFKGSGDDYYSMGSATTLTLSGTRTVLSNSVSFTATSTTSGILVVVWCEVVEDSTGFSVGDASLHIGSSTVTVLPEKSLPETVMGHLVTQVDQSTIPFSFDRDNRYEVTLTGDRTISFVEARKGSMVRLKLTQDGTGSRIVTWPTSGVTINWIDGPEPALQTTAGESDWIDLICVDDTASAEVYDGWLVGRGKRHTQDIIARLVATSNVHLNPAWHADTLAYSSNNEDIGALVTGTEPLNFTFGDSGDKLYVVERVDDLVYELDLSTPYDITTATDSGNTLDCSSEETALYAVELSADGTKLYAVGQANDTVYQYTLSTPWDLSTGSYASKNMSVSSQVTQPTGIRFKTDGTACYVIGDSSDTVYQYTLSTAWDISSGSYASKSFSVATQEGSPTGLVFKPDGTKMFVCGFASKQIREYALSTAWDVSSASYTAGSGSIGGTVGTPIGLAVDADGENFFVMSYTDDTLYEFVVDPDPGDIDSVTPANGNIILLTNQDDADENGTYDAVDADVSTTWIRHKLTDGMSATGTCVRVTAGTAKSTSTWVCESLDGADLVGTNNLTFTEY